MKKMFLISAILFLSACGQVQNEEKISQEKIAKENLIIVGEGGTSGSMFLKSADTYRKENGGVVYEVHSGDEFVAAVRDFVSKYGKIKHLEYFGHGNHVGLYVNQTPNVNGGLYANDPDLNVDYKAGSIYELETDIFAKYGWVKFNGCNVADGYPEKDTLAQRTANYFNVDVVAPMGPTEFSSKPKEVDPIEQSNYLDPDFDRDVYMVPTYGDEGFVTVKPQDASESGFVDVRVGQIFEESVKELSARGLDLGFKEKRFWPYNVISNDEALKFCKVAFGDACQSQGKGDLRIRNLKALKMLTDAAGVSLKTSNPWYSSYVYYANKEALLTEDFVSKKWYTRAEMAELTWNFMKKFAKN